MKFNDLKLKQEVIDAYEKYLDAFKLGNQSAVNSCVTSPNYRIENGVIQTFEKFHTDLTKLKKQGYKTTIAADYSVVAVDDKKAHLLLREALRIDDKDEPFQTISSFYILVKDNGSWKIMFASGMVETV